MEGAEPNRMTRGIAAYVECWNGDDWSPRFTMFSERGSDGPFTEIYNPSSAIEQIGFDGTKPALFRAPVALSPGWYRIRMSVSANEGGYSKSYKLWALVRAAD